MPRIVADTERCQSYGACLTAAPEVFDVDEDAEHVVLLRESVPDSERAGVDEAVEACPMQALRLVEG